MKEQWINPFIEGVNGLFSTMLGCDAERGDIKLWEGRGNPRDVTALIGLSGPARGIVALSFPAGTALSMVSAMLGTDLRTLDDTVCDAVAEMVNIVAGSAKAKFCAGDGAPIELSLPTIVRGADYSVEYPFRTTWLDVPFTSELGPFVMRVTFEMRGKNGGGER